MTQFSTQTSEWVNPTRDLDKFAAGMEVLGSSEIPIGAGNQLTLDVGLRKPADLILLFISCTGLTAEDTLAVRFNGNNEAVYWAHNDISIQGGATFSSDNDLSQTSMRFATTLTGVTNNDSGGLQHRMVFALITNKDTVEKMGVWFQCRATNSVATPGNLFFGTGSWVKTGTRISNITLLTAGGTALLKEGTGFVVYGKDFP